MWKWCWWCSFGTAFGNITTLPYWHRWTLVRPSQFDQQLVSSRDSQACSIALYYDSSRLACLLRCSGCVKSEFPSEAETWQASGNSRALDLMSSAQDSPPMDARSPTTGY